MKWVGALCVLLCVCCAGRVGGPGEAPPPRDIDLLHEAVVGACETVLAALPGNIVGHVVISQAGQEKGAWLVEEALCQGLLVRGWDVRQPSGGGSRRDTAATGDRLVVEYRIVKMDIRYQSFGKPLLRSVRVEREAEVELAFRLLDDERGLLVWLGRGGGEARGVVHGSALHALADAEFSPPVDEWPRSRPWAVEVAVMGGLVGLLLAVFYAGTV